MTIHNRRHMYKGILFISNISNHQGTHIKKPETDTIKNFNLIHDFNWTLYLSFLTWPPGIASMLNIRGWSLLPRAEASGALVTVPIGLHDTLYTIRQNFVRLSLVLLSYHYRPFIIP